MKQVEIPLRDFALPVPRSGSLETPSGYGRSAADGLDIHLRIQKKRAGADPSYQAEVPVTALFERGGYRFRVDGRMDGIFRRDPPVIEEIKSAFALRELHQRLAGDPMDHPYGLQLLTYGYLYWLDHHVQPKLTFHLVSSRNGETEDLEIALDLRLYEKWLELRLGELVIEAGYAWKRAVRRRRIADGLTFPFEQPRPGQIELMRTIEQGMSERRPMLIQAPTGLGKTAGVLFPVLKEALSRGQNVVYVTPKNSQHSVAEDAVARFQGGGSPVKSLSITAKNKICFKEEPLCNPEYCEFARDYYSKVHQQGVIALLAKKRKLKARTFRELGMKYQVCPFELQLDSALDADVVICDYNYVFAPRSALGRVTGLSIDQSGKPGLVIDEAHNLPGRAMDYYSPALSSMVLHNMREDLRRVWSPFRREAEELLDACIGILASCGTRAGTHPMKINPPVAGFLEQAARLRAFLSRYLESQAEIQRNDPILALCFYWSEFTEKLELALSPDRPEFFTTYHPHPAGVTLKITCCDASAMLSDCFGKYDQVVGFSATLKPFDYYVKLSGLDARTVRTAEFSTPFPTEHRKLLIIPQISTKFTDRQRNYAKVADAISKLAAVRSGNYFAFVPSFEFLEKMTALFQPPPGFAVLKQERGMKAAQVESILDHLSTRSVPTIVFAVQGGSFAEGMDYAGEMVIGVFVIGPPLPNYDLEREQMREYYQRHYGAGFEYAYTIPAMAKAVQAAGRVIRSETDRGLIVLMDGRFTEPNYSCAMPRDWFEEDVKELVSSSILREIAEFWEGGKCSCSSLT